MLSILNWTILQYWVWLAFWQTRSRHQKMREKMRHERVGADMFKCARRGVWVCRRKWGHRRIATLAFSIPLSLSPYTLHSEDFGKHIVAIDNRYQVDILSSSNVFTWSLPSSPSRSRYCFHCNLFPVFLKLFSLIRLHLDIVQRYNGGPVDNG